MLSEGAASLVALAALLAAAIAGGGLTPMLVAAGAWLCLPAASAVVLSRTGQLDVAYAFSAVTLSGLAVLGALLWGGVGLFVAAWLMVVPLEAALSSSRRAVLLASLLASSVLVALAGADAAGLLAAPQLPAESLRLIDQLGTLGAVLYGAGIVARLEGLYRSAQLEAELAQDRFRLLADHATDLITCHDAGGKVTFASGAAERLLGTTASSLIGNGLLERVQVADRPLYLTTLDQCARLGEERSIELRLNCGRAAGAVIWAELRCRPLHKGPPSAGAVVAVVRDITARKAEEGELVRARDAADGASRAKSQFLASMSHELRTPLNSIIGFSSMMSGEMGRRMPAEQQADYARIIQASGEHLLQLVNDLLDLTRIEAGRYEMTLEALDAGPLVAECLKIVAPQASSRGIVLSQDVAPGLPEVLADRRAMRQILLNLLSNAIKFNRDGGSVCVRMEAREGGLVLAVADTGIGIEAGDIARLGQPFVQADRGLSRRYEGAGLGLSIVMGLVRILAGEMRIESRPGEGTTVRLVFQQAAAASGGPRAAFLASEAHAIGAEARAPLQAI